MKAARLTGNKIILREFHDSQEFEQIRLWRNIPENRRLFFTEHEISHDEHHEWGNRVADDPSRCIFAIADQLTDRLVGYISILVDHVGKNVEFGIMIGDVSDRGAGYAEEAERLLCEYVSSAYGVNTAVMEVFATNERAIRFYEKTGYQKQKVLKNEKKQDGRFCDVVVMTKSI